MAKKITNAYEIIKAQMLSGREICKNEEYTGATVSVSLPGAPKAQVVRVEGDDFILEEIVPEGKSPREFVLSADKALAYHYVGNNNPKVTPEATLEKGIFTVDGKEIFLGQLEPRKIIACVKGFVLLAFDAPAEDGLIIGCYDVQKDEFSILFDSDYEWIEDLKNYTDFFAAVTSDGMTYIVGQRVETVEETDEDGVAAVFERASRPDVYAVYEHHGSKPEINLMARSLATDIVVSDFEVVGNGYVRFLVLHYDREMVNGKIEDCAVNSDDTKIFPLQNSAEEVISAKYSPEVFIGGKPGYDPVLTAKSDNGMKIYYRGVVTEVLTPTGEMDGYNYFAGYERGVDEDDNPQVTYTYADAEQNVKRFTLTETDRGTLVKFF